MSNPRRRAMAVLAATVVGAVVTANLGAWQLRRAAQKIALQHEIETRASEAAVCTAELARDAEGAQAQHYRPARVRGTWVGARTVFLENRQMDGRVGFYVVTPLRLDDRPDAVLVQRGWVPRDLRDRTLLPEVPTPPGVVEIAGHVAPPPARLFQLGPGEATPIRQNLDLDAFKAESGLALLPLSVQQGREGGDRPGAAGSDGLTRDWPLPAVDVQKHYGYAFQWFALCALMVILYVWFQLVRPRLARRA